MRQILSVALVLVLLAAGLHCASVTVYVSWPSPEQLREATAAIVADVRPALPSAGTPAAASPMGLGRAAVVPVGWPVAGSESTHGSIILVEMNLQVSTPTIRRIKESLAKRFPPLLPHYQAGRLGESNMGELALLRTDGLSLKDRASLQKLVKAENGDRNTLYQEFLKANHLDPERLPELKKQFALSWQKQAHPGWYIQTAKGEWIKKPQPKPGQTT